MPPPAQTVAARQAASAAQAVEAVLVAAQQTGDELVLGLDSGMITPDGVPAAILAAFEAHPQFWGVGATYDPRQAGRSSRARSATTTPTRRSRAREVGSAWVPPDLGGTSQKMVAVHAARFLGPNPSPDGSPAGVVIISIQLDTLH